MSEQVSDCVCVRTPESSRVEPLGFRITAAPRSPPRPSVAPIGAWRCADAMAGAAPRCHQWPTTSALRPRSGQTCPSFALCHHGGRNYATPPGLPRCRSRTARRDQRPRATALAASEGRICIRLQTMICATALRRQSIAHLHRCREALVTLIGPGTPDRLYSRVVDRDSRVKTPIREYYIYATIV